MKDQGGQDPQVPMPQKKVTTPELVWVVQYSTVPPSTVQYRVATALYSTVLHFNCNSMTVLYSTVLCCERYSTVLYSYYSTTYCN